MLLPFCCSTSATVVVDRVGVVTDPPLQESVSDPQTLLDALEEPVIEPLTLNPTDSDVSL